ILGLLYVAVQIMRAAHERAQWNAAREAGHCAETWALVEVPDGGRIYRCRPYGAPVPLASCPPGPFLWAGRLHIKRGNTAAWAASAIDVDGDNLPVWSGTRDLRVQPVILETVDPEPFWVET